MISIRNVAIVIALCFSASPLFAKSEGPGSPTEDQAVVERQALQKKWGGFAPKGWRVLMAATGSLLAEKSNDAVLVIEQQDPAKIVSNEGFGTDKVNTNPRHMLILSKQGERYVVKGRIERFLPSEGDPEAACLADPLMEGPGIEIAKSVMSINMKYWYSCGSWYVNGNTYKFRAEKGRFRLIGLESWVFHRASGIGSTASINYLTGRKKDVDNVVGIGPDPEVEDGDSLPAPVTKWSKVSRGPFFLDAMDRRVCADYGTAPSWCND